MSGKRTLGPGQLCHQMTKLLSSLLDKSAVPSAGQKATVRETTTLPPGIWVCERCVKLTWGARFSQLDSTIVFPHWHVGVGVYGLVFILRGVANTGQKKNSLVLDSLGVLVGFPIWLGSLLEKPRWPLQGLLV